LVTSLAEQAFKVPKLILLAQWHHHAEFVVTWGYDISEGNYHPYGYLI
jgi:hypothetical protein